MMRLHKLQPLVVAILFMVVLFPANVSGHTPSIITSNLSVDGPLPANITETTEFYEGDSVYFRMGDSGENVTMRVSIDIDGDGMFNQSNDIFSNWLNYSCELNENGTATLDENCSKSFTYKFSENNSEGIYYYQVERRVELNHTDSWLNTIYVGIDVHSEDGVVSIGDCFGAGCDEVESQSNSDSNEFELDLVKILILISAIGVIGLSVSIIKENRDLTDQIISKSEE
ncbi:MAG: hypothetical protein HN433_06680 [Euryarchaeota archaeon]|jgi:hypothetical protein|nr:hypothetical protein [Euryarchaeota archaeon]